MKLEQLDLFKPEEVETVGEKFVIFHEGKLAFQYNPHVRDAIARSLARLGLDAVEHWDLINKAPEEACLPILRAWNYEVIIPQKDTAYLQIQKPLIKYRSYTRTISNRIEIPIEGL